MRFLVLLLLPLSVFGQNNDTTIYDFPDVEARFPGGAAKMQHFITENIVYPDSLVEMDEISKIYFTFIVEKDGSLSNIDVLKPVNPIYHEHYMELMLQMPAWIPAQLNGRNVRSRCRLPIIICLR